MATEAPWSEPGFTTPLEQWLGANWEQRLEDKWGSGWQASCAQELVYSVGSDWADQPDVAAEKLAGLVSEEAPVPEELDPEQPLSIDFGDYPWLNSVAQSGSVQSWLVQVGAPEDLAAALADENGGASAETANVDPDQPVTVDLSQYEWFSIVAEADSLQAWLTRVGVPDDLAAALADESAGVAAESASVDPDQPITVDLSQYEWFRTVTEADSLQAWLTRVGVPDDLATALAEANG